MSRIERLTPEQEALIPVYREKWRAIALSTELIDRQKAVEAVKAAYVAIGKQAPEVLVCDSPQALPKTFTSILKRRLSREMEWLVERYSDEQRMEQLRQELGSPLSQQLAE